jgi:large subunit ribosomal protein L30
MGWMIVRVRGSIHANRGVTETLGQLHLTRPNHVTVVPETPPFRGMITRVQGYVTWGEADPTTVGRLLQERGETIEGRKLSAGLPPEVGSKDLPELARAITEGGLPAARKLKPLFRLRAPKGGWRSTKKPYDLGGALGYRGPKINELAERML